MQTTGLEITFGNIKRKTIMILPFFLFSCDMMIVVNDISLCFMKYLYLIIVYSTCSSSSLGDNSMSQMLLFSVAIVVEFECELRVFAVEVKEMVSFFLDLLFFLLKVLLGDFLSMNNAS